MKSGEFKIIPFEPVYQKGARRLILEGLGEHWGWIDEYINTDLEDISVSYASGHFVLGFFKEKLVATGALIPEDEFTKRIVRMSVAKEFRRHGFGSQILKHLISLARRTSTKKVVLETTETWDDVIAFYESFGFQIDRYRDGDVHLFLIL